mmetsp:Transcript_60236/g.138198  ORF Transcript_60236/g.138198 Transcript_60236/m.138198 type:complete len:469 (+) Transcript_60236:1089-2495(+)
MQSTTPTGTFSMRRRKFGFSGSASAASAAGASAIIASARSRTPRTSARAAASGLPICTLVSAAIRSASASSASRKRAHSATRSSTLVSAAHSRCAPAAATTCATASAVGSSGTRAATAPEYGLSTSSAVVVVGGAAARARKALRASLGARASCRAPRMCTRSRALVGSTRCCSQLASSRERRAGSSRSSPMRSLAHSSAWAAGASSMAMSCAACSSSATSSAKQPCASSSRRGSGSRISRPTSPTESSGWYCTPQNSPAPMRTLSACTGDHSLEARICADTPAGSVGTIAQRAATWSVCAASASKVRIVPSYIGWRSPAGVRVMSRERPCSRPRGLASHGMPAAVAATCSPQHEPYCGTPASKQRRASSTCRRTSGTSSWMVSEEPVHTTPSKRSSSPTSATCAALSAGVMRSMSMAWSAGAISCSSEEKVSLARRTFSEASRSRPSRGYASTTSMLSFVAAAGAAVE